MVRAARRNGAEIRTRTELLEAGPGQVGWTARIGDVMWHGDTIIDAAGAWGDVAATRCGVEPVGLTPMRRSAFMVAGEERLAGTPMVIDAHHEWYFKPDGSQILCSLAEENPADPHGRPRSRPARRRPRHRTDQRGHHARHPVGAVGLVRAAHLRPDRVMVIGSDPGADGFVWLVGHGGTGIQTAPAAGRLAAAAVLGEPVPDDLLAAGVDVDALRAQAG